jgi:hypothetical protein
MKAADQLQALARPFRDRTEAVQALSAAIHRQGDKLERPTDVAPRERRSPIPPSLAARWLAHVSSVRDAAARFRSEAENIVDPTWKERLNTYADALEAAAESSPREELASLTQATPVPPPQATRTPVPAELFANAGFKSVPDIPESLFVPINDLGRALQHYLTGLDALTRDLGSHAARKYSENREELLKTLCYFELARGLRRAGPILAASEQLVAELLRGRLAPVVRELVASLVRFEWYFKPLLIPDAGRRIVLGGLATSSERLDARLLLNSAERTALGVAWFMAMHLLQPEDRRQVLVMDDPASVFDAANQAGFISTLRAFVRLTRPKQMIVASHDDAVASVLAEELTPVDGWPKAVMRVRCQRNSSDVSVLTSEWSADDSRNIEGEAETLQLGDEAATAN